MTEKTGKIKEILCRILSNGTGIAMSAENGASRFSDEINRFFRHEIMFENRISGSHCFPAPIMKPSAAFSSNSRMVSFMGAVLAYHGACGIPTGIPNSFRSSGVVPFTAMLLSILIGLRSFNRNVRRLCTFSKKNLKIN